MTTTVQSSAHDSLRVNRQVIKCRLLTARQGQSKKLVREGIGSEDKRKQDSAHVSLLLQSLL